MGHRPSAGRGLFVGAWVGKILRRRLIALTVTKPYGG